MLLWIPVFLSAFSSKWSVHPQRVRCCCLETGFWAEAWLGVCPLEDTWRPVWIPLSSEQPVLMLGPLTRYLTGFKLCVVWWFTCAAALAAVWWELWLHDSSCSYTCILPHLCTWKVWFSVGVEDFVCLVTSLHLCCGSEEGAEGRWLAWFDRAQSANSALLGAVAGGDYKVVLTLLRGGIFVFGFISVVRRLCGTCTRWGKGPFCRGGRGGGCEVTVTPMSVRVVFANKVLSQRDLGLAAVFLILWTCPEALKVLQATCMGRLFSCFLISSPPQHYSVLCNCFV